MTRTRWIIFAVICLFALGALVFLSSKDKVDVSKIDEKKIVTTGAIKDRIFGSKDAKVLLIEYGDFQCPGCETLYANLKPLKENYKNQITFVYRQLPLTSIHPNAFAAASAAEAAGQQGKFYEMHDQLYDNQSLWEKASVSDRFNNFTEYAKNIGIDTNQFKKDFESKAVADKIRRDQALAGKLNITSTPTLYLNGELVEGTTWQASEKLEKVIRDAIKASGQTLPKPVNPSI